MKTHYTPLIAAFIKKYGISISLIANKLNVKRATLSFKFNNSKSDSKYYTKDLIAYLEQMQLDLNQLLEEIKKEEK